MKHITAETFLEYRFPSDVRISPDGSLCAFVLRKADLEKNSYPGDVWVLERATGQVRRLTAQGDALDFAFLPDGSIVFSAPRGREAEKAREQGRVLTQYFSISPYGGEALPLCTLPVSGSAPRVLPDGRWLVCAKVDLNRPDFSAMDEEQRKTALREYENPRFRVFEELPFWANGRGDVSRVRRSLFVCDPAQGSAERVTAEYFDVSSYDQMGQTVVFTGSEYRDFLPMYEGLYACGADGVRTLIEPGQYELGEVHLVDEKTVVLTLRGSEEHLYAHGDIWRVNVETGEKTRLCAYDRSFGSSSVASDSRLGGGMSAVACGGALYFATTEDEDSYVRCLMPDGTISERLTAPGGSVDCFDVRDGEILMVAMRGMRLPELYSVRGGEERRLTSFNEWVQEQYELSQPQPVRFTASDGFEIHGYIMQPAGYEPGKKYPAILHIHGGPRGAFGSVFHNEMQLWAARGYFVFYCNPRGGDGRGAAFADLLDKYGDVDYKNLMEFTDYCLANCPDADPERLGVTGGSYGGVMTNWIIGHTDRFRAACSQRCIANWISFEGTTDIGYWFNYTQHGTLTAENPQRLWELSPLAYADNVKTPTLFIHAEEDYRCYMAEGLQMFTALKMHGVESRLVLFRGENHDLSRTGRPRSRIRRMEEIAGWMDAHLKG